MKVSFRICTRILCTSEQKAVVSVFGFEYRVLFEIEKLLKQENQLVQGWLKLLHLFFISRRKLNWIVIPSFFLAFYEERALVLGRLKHHEQVSFGFETSNDRFFNFFFYSKCWYLLFQALAIYTSILNDFDAAEEYCRIYYDQSDETNSQVCFLFILTLEVKPSIYLIGVFTSFPCFCLPFGSHDRWTSRERPSNSSTRCSQCNSSVEQACG